MNINQFIRKSLLVSSIALLLFFLMLFLANGYTDMYYRRFTSPKQKSMILGTSRAAMGINPSKIQEKIGRDIYNYAFTLESSPYGPTYLKSIKNKLDTTTKDNVFILSVNPWSISSRGNYPDSAEVFRELKRFLATTKNVSSNPNFEYLIENLSGRYLDILTNNIMSSYYLHGNGWLDLDVDMDSEKVDKRTKVGLNNYRNNGLHSYNYSSLRFSYLIETIQLLRNYGQVFLVRVPVHPDMMVIENELMPDFNQKIQELVPVTDGYMDLTPYNAEFEYIDGNHLHRLSANKVSRMIGDWVKSNSTNIIDYQIK